MHALPLLLRARNPDFLIISISQESFRLFGTNETLSSHPLFLRIPIYPVFGSWPVFDSNCVVPFEQRKELVRQVCLISGRARSPNLVAGQTHGANRNDENVSERRRCSWVSAA